jgi:hypothetical protein
MNLQRQPFFISFSVKEEDCLFKSSIMDDEQEAEFVNV